MSERPDVLVVGAGPAGLTTALQVHDHGGTVRVVESRPEEYRPSRALIMHPRTLEMLRPAGVTDALLECGDTAPAAELHLGRRIVPVRLADLALPDTAFPHLTLLRQMDVERVLAAALAERGVTVERGTALVRVTSGETAARAVLDTAGHPEHVTCSFVAGCDGTTSTVRSGAAIAWHGGTYREEVVLADVELAGELTPDVLHVVAGRRGLLFVFALGEGATWRILATRPTPTPAGATAPGPAYGQPGEPVTERDLQDLLDIAGLDAAVTEVAWSARVPLQHRVADRYRAGRLFLAGDAAHSHSPAGAQGMNTGIQDAVNLGWKLAHAVGGGHRTLLDSYEQERRPVARQVLAMTHLIFFAEASTHPLPSFLRGTVVPLAAPAVPLVLRRRRLVAEGVRVLSQLRVRYRGSPISVEGSPVGTRHPHPGDRLPDTPVTCDGWSGRLHELTARPGVHVLLSRDAEPFDGALLGPRVFVHRLTSSPGQGLAAVRPDGYVGFRCGVADVAQLGAWLDLVGAR